MKTITTFNNLLSTHPQTVSLSDVFEQMKTDKNLQMLTEMHRQGVGQKQCVSVFVPSAIMEGGRKTENIINPSAKLNIRHLGAALTRQGFTSRISRGIKQYLVRVE